MDYVVYQRGEADLYEAGDGRAVRGDEGRYLRVVVHVAVVQLDHPGHLVLNLINMGESQLQEAGIDGLCLVLGVELAYESGGDQAYPVSVIEQAAEVVLLDVYGLVGTGLDALAAIHALVVADDSLAVTDADGCRRAGAHTGGAALAQVVVYPERMSEIDFLGHKVMQGKLSW